MNGRHPALSSGYPEEVAWSNGTGQGFLLNVKVGLVRSGIPSMCKWASGWLLRASLSPRLLRSQPRSLQGGFSLIELFCVVICTSQDNFLPSHQVTRKTLSIDALRMALWGDKSDVHG